MLRAQDVLIVLKLAALGRPISYAALGASLGISASQTHSAAKRAIEAGLLREDLQVRGRAVLEMLKSLRFFLPAVFRGLERGMPTAHGASPIREWIVADSEPVPVWPDAQGTVRGIALEPIYKTAPLAAKSDPNLYELLVLVDALRIGRSREAEFAEAELGKRLGVQD